MLLLSLYPNHYPDTFSLDSKVSIPIQTHAKSVSIRIWIHLNLVSVSADTLDRYFYTCIPQFSTSNLL